MGKIVIEDYYHMTTMMEYFGLDEMNTSIVNFF